MNEELKRLIDAARSHNMTADEISRQRVSFAFGNAPKGDTNTKESVRMAINQGEISRAE